jgi:hypothetical protein
MSFRKFIIACEQVAKWFEAVVVEGDAVDDGERP